MHFEVLVEDASGKIALEYILEKILRSNELNHTYRVVSYRGIGHIPKDLKGKIDPKKRVLLNQLPRLLKGYGKSFKDVPDTAVIVVVDLDKKNCLDFKQELLSVLNSCNPHPTTLFRIAIEEGEAWLLGDRNAIRKAYPRVKEPYLSNYVQDSICGTWEHLADAIHSGGHIELEKSGFPTTGQTKCDWARKIAPLLEPESNESPSFQVFRDGIKQLAGI